MVIQKTGAHTITKHNNETGTLVAGGNISSPSGKIPMVMSRTISDDKFEPAVVVPPLRSSDKAEVRVIQPLQRIRRLTPTECERLQAFPDGWTQKGLDKTGREITISDTQRYRCLGNAVTTSVISAIGANYSVIPEEGKK